MPNATGYLKIRNLRFLMLFDSVLSSRMPVSMKKTRIMPEHLTTMTQA